MIEAGKLRERVTFQARGLDVNGDPLGDWQPGFRVAARVRSLRAGEPVLQARLRGVTTYEITVRATARTAALTTADRAVWKGTPLNIRGLPGSEDRREIVLLCDDDGSDE